MNSHVQTCRAQECKLSNCCLCWDLGCLSECRGVCAGVCVCGKGRVMLTAGGQTFADS